MKLFQVDAFTDTLYKGNPAAVCFPKPGIEKSTLQAFAAEMNLSETAYLWKQETNRYELRWFTPAVEVNLCGHATLASAHVIFSEKLINGFQKVIFETRSGILEVIPKNNMLEMDFPSVNAIPYQPEPALTGCFINNKGSWYSCGENIMIVMENEDQVIAEIPDHTTLRKMPYFGYIITAQSQSGDFDFVSRYFAPAQGVDEDPVTGSAHCALAPYWAKRLDKPVLRARQISNRGGTLEVQPLGQRVKIRGKAVTVFSADVPNM